MKKSGTFRRGLLTKGIAIGLSFALLTASTGVLNVCAAEGLTYETEIASEDGDSSEDLFAGSPLLGDEQNTAEQWEGDVSSLDTVEQVQTDSSISQSPLPGEDSADYSSETDSFPDTSDTLADENLENSDGDNSGAWIPESGYAGTSDQAIDSVAEPADYTDTNTVNNVNTEDAGFIQEEPDTNTMASDDDPSEMAEPNDSLDENNTTDSVTEDMDSEAQTEVNPESENAGFTEETEADSTIDNNSDQEEEAEEEAEEAVIAEETAIPENQDIFSEEGTDQEDNLGNNDNAEEAFTDPVQQDFIDDPSDFSIVDEEKINDAINESTMQSDTTVEGVLQDSEDSPEETSENLKNSVSDYDDEYEETIAYLDIDTSSVEIYAGETRNIPYNDDYYWEDILEKIKTVSSSNSSVAAVDYTNDNIVVSGKKPGTATVTVTGDRGSVFTISVNVVSVLSVKSVSVLAEGYKMVDIIDAMDEDTYEYIHSSYTASSSDREVATAYIKDLSQEDEDWVYDRDYRLVINGLKPGKAVITVKDNEQIGISTITVTVEKPSFSLSTDNVTLVGEEDYIVKSTGSNISNASSSSSEIVAVTKTDDKELKLSALKPGKATVTVNNYFGDSEKIVVTVNKPSFTVNKTDVTFRASNFYTLTTYGSKIATVSSSNTNILIAEKTADNKVLLTPKKPGSATVSITNSYGTVCKVTAKIVTFLRYTNVTFEAGNSHFYEEYEFFKDDEAYYDWNTSLKTSDKTIATAVYADGEDYGYWNNGYLIKGKNPGKATINVTCSKTGAVCPITVTVNKPAFTMARTSVTLRASEHYVVGATSSTIGSVKSSDPSIVVASKNDYNRVLLTPKKIGNATVTVTDLYGSTCKITVKIVTFLRNTNVTFEAGNSHLYYDYEFFKTDEYYYDTSLTTSDKAIATAVYRNGYLLTGKTPGKATINVTCSRTGAVCPITVTVIKPTFTMARTSVTLRASQLYTVGATRGTISSVKCSNTSVVTASKTKYNSVLLTPKKVGNATVTVTDPYGSTCKITVKIVTFLRHTNVTFVAGNSHYYEHYEFFKTDEEYYDISLTTSDKTIATATHSNYSYSDGVLITGKNPGKATINVKCSETGAVCPISVTVKAPPFTLSASKLTLNSVKEYAVTASGSDIGKISNSNTNILTVQKLSDRKVKFIPLKVGKTTVTLTSKYGVSRKVSITVDKQYFKALLTSKTKPDAHVYGLTNMTGKTAPAASVTASVSGKNYTAKAASDGKYVIKNIPIVKIGTVISVKYSLQGQTLSKTVTVGKGKSTVYTPNYTYKDTTKVPVEVTNVHSGDQIKITVDGKNYYRKFKASYKKNTVPVTIKKVGKYGIRMTVRLMNKFNQELAKYSDYVYLSDTVHVGDTKAIVKWLTGWNNPVSKSYYTGGETWYYDWYGDDGTDAYLEYDENGKVEYWHIWD